MTTKDYWSETLQKYSTLIDNLQIKEKYFQKPAPSYIFHLVMNTLKKTGFPNGLFSEKQKSFEYFKRNLEHKKKILGKITELINFIIEKEEELQIDINIQDILKGQHPEITNKFLLKLYEFATNGKNYNEIIQEYKLKRNKDKYLYKNIEIPKGETITDKGLIIWIDKHAKSEENQKLLKNLQNNKQYQQMKNFEKICINNVQNALMILLSIKFKIVYVIISGDLYPEYYYEVKKYKNVLKCIPICSIYTTDELKNAYLKRIRYYLLNNEIYDSINNSFYNYGGINSDFYSSLDFISNFYFCIKNKFFQKREREITYKGNITFEKINSEFQLIIPFLLNDLIKKENKVSDNEIQYFKYMLSNRHENDRVIHIINPILFTRDMSHELLLKFFIRAYTEKSTFFESMNTSLFKKENDEYVTFVNLLYEGLSNNSLQISIDDCLYRNCTMLKNDINKLIDQFNIWKQNNDKSLPSFLIYSRCFLSFTKDKDRVIISQNNNLNNNYNVFFILKNNEKIINKYTANADIENISIFEEEKEVLFFPFTTFILNDIYEGEINGNKCIIVNIEYLDVYEHILKKFKQDNECQEKIRKSFISFFKNQNYIKKLLENNFLGSKNDDNNENENRENKENKDKKIISIIKRTIKEQFDIEINEEIKEENDVINNSIIEIDEIITVHYKDKKPKDLLINKELLKYQEFNDKVVAYTGERVTVNSGVTTIYNNNNKAKYRYFFIPHFKEQDIELIWRGNYNKLNEKEGKGKEYNLEENLIFEGEYIKGEKKSGIEYYIKEIKKYEGEYQYNKKWNGFLYDILGKNSYEIKSGNGKIKEFHENSNLCYEGEINDGIKNGFGKMFDEYGRLIYEGNFFNDMKNGEGKEYNQNGNLIFEGEFIDGKKGDGNIYKYNNQNELIYEKKFINGKYITKKIKSIKDYKNHLMIKENLFLMENNNIHYGLEYEIEGDYKFSGEYKNGKKWNGKFKKLYPDKKLFIEGEYKNGIKYWKEYDKLGSLIFDGKYEKENEYSGKKYKKGKLVFEGIYLNGKKCKGIEYNNKNMKIFEGTYKSGKRWNGQMKLFSKFYKLIFDGKIKNGKIYEGVSNQINKKLDFEGIYKNGRKWNGKGIEQIGKFNLIFEGEFLDGKKYNGNFYTFDKFKQKKLIGNLVNGNAKNIKIFNYHDQLMLEVDFSKGEFIKGKEYNKFGDVIFEGEYKNGKRYNGIYKIKIFNKIYSYYFYKGKVFNKFIENDNEIIYDGEYKDNKKEGKGKEYNKKWQLIFIGEFTNGYRFKGKEFNENGELVFNGKYSKGLHFDGYRKEYIDEFLKFEGEIKNGLKLKGKEYDINGNIIFEGEYKDGQNYKCQKYKGKERYYNGIIFEGEYKNEGKGKEYDNKNRLIFEGEYNNNNRIKGKEYSSSGELIYNGSYSTIGGRNIRWNGSGKEYKLINNTNKLIFEGEYKNGKIWNGKVYKFDSGGNLLYEGEYKESLLVIFNRKKKENKNLNKEKKQFSQILNEPDTVREEEIKLEHINDDENNKKYFLNKYKDAEDKYYLNNKLKYEKKKLDENKYYYIEYDANGQIIFEGEYINNEKYKGKEYNFYGEIIYEGFYKNNERYNGNGYNNFSQFKYIDGKIEGNIVTYDYSKHELFEGEYKNGEKFNGKLKTYFDSYDYILKREIEVKNGKLSGKGKEYYRNNRLKYIGDYEDGQINGKGELYYQDYGYINYIGEFKNGEKDGIGKEFDKFGNLINEGEFKNGNLFKHAK